MRRTAGVKGTEGERDIRIIADHVSVEGVARIQQEGHLTTTDSSQGWTELFTVTCEKVKATPRQFLQLASPTPAASTNTTPPEPATRVEAVAALKANLTIADNYNKFSLSSGYTVPVEAERVIKQAALNCAEKYFDDEEKQGLPIRNAVMEEFSISSRAKKTNTTGIIIIVAELLRACVTRGVTVSREELGI